MEERRQQRRTGTADVGAILRRLEQTITSVAEFNAELMRRLAALEQRDVQTDASALATERLPRRSVQGPIVQALDGPALIGPQTAPLEIRSEYELERTRFKQYMSSDRTPKRVLRVRKGEEYEAIIAGHRIIYTAGKYPVPELLFEVYEAWRERMEEAHDIARKFMATDENGNMDLGRLGQAINAMEGQRSAGNLPDVASALGQLAGEPEAWET